MRTSSRPPDLLSRLADLPLGAIPVIALATAIAPFVLQIATLLLTGSEGWTLFVGGLLASAFIAAAFVWHASVAGSLHAVSRFSLVGTAIAVLVYHFIAFSAARLLMATVFAPEA